MNELAILLSGAMTTAPALPYETTYPGFYIITNSPGLVLTNTWHPERRTGLPGTPREGEVLTTEEVNLRPCFAAVYPACPGHLHTNLTRWRWTSGAWDRIPETNEVAVMGESVTNLLLGDSIQWTNSAVTNITFQMPDSGSGYRSLRKALKALVDALEAE